MSKSKVYTFVVSVPGIGTFSVQAKSKQTAYNKVKKDIWNTRHIHIYPIDQCDIVTNEERLVHAKTQTTLVTFHD